MRSKFTDILNSHRRFLLGEAKFVKGDEDSELPDMQDEEEPQPEEQPQEPNQEPSPEEQPQEPEVDQTAFTNREQDILNVALAIYRADDNRSIESKNDLAQMFEQGQYEELFGRLIAIADELSD